MALLGTLYPESARILEPPNAAMKPPAPGDWHWKARRVLARFGARTLPALVEALAAGDDPAIRQFAAESLGLLGHEARSAADALHHAALHDADRAVRAAAAEALKAVGETDSA